MKAYSIDLREKIVNTYKKGGQSQRQIAKTFNVALSFIQKILKQERETGDISPKPHGGGVSLKLNTEEMTILFELIEKNNDATLDELCFFLKEKIGVVVSRATMGRYTQKLKLTLKKKHCIQQKKKLKGCNN